MNSFLSKTHPTMYQVHFQYAFLTWDIIQVGHSFRMHVSFNLSICFGFLPWQQKHQMCSSRNFLFWSLLWNRLFSSVVCPKYLILHLKRDRSLFCMQLECWTHDSLNLLKSIQNIFCTMQIKKNKNIDYVTPLFKPSRRVAKESKSL